MRFLFFVFYQTLCIEIRHRFDFYDVIDVREASTCYFPVLLPKKNIDKKNTMMSIPRKLLLILLTLLEVLSEVMISFSDLIEKFRKSSGFSEEQRAAALRHVARRRRRARLQGTYCPKSRSVY